MTIEAWFMPESSGTFQAIFSKEGDDGVVYSLGIYPTGELFWNFTTENDDVFTELTGITPDLNTWTHAALVYDKSYVTIYVNGVSSNARPVTGAMTPNDSRFAIGSIDLTGFYLTFDGKIDEVRAWSSARTPEEISANNNYN
jgi:hypothetical protein